MYARVAPIKPEGDAKLQTFLTHMRGPLKNKKVLVFTSYVDTANYIFDHYTLNGGVQANDADVVASSSKNKSRAVARFAPRANEAVWKKHQSEGELRVLVATDVLAEGLNMQDCDIIVNYDLHWNPVRLIQRFGRIDRIGSEHENIYGYNFLPETGLEKNLGIEKILANRIQEIHKTLGEDAAILHPDEALDESAMKAIYTGEIGGKSGLFSSAERDELAWLNEAEVLLKNLREQEPDAWKGVLDLRLCVRSAKVEAGSAGKKIVVCRAGDFVQLYLCDGIGNILSRDPETILPILESARELLAPAKIPSDHNAVVTKVLADFEREMKMRRVARQASRRAGAGQKWVAERLLEWYRLCDDDQKKSQIQTVEAALRSDGLPKKARDELNALHKNKVAGEKLWSAAELIYQRFDLKSRAQMESEREEEWPQIVCSLALI